MSVNAFNNLINSPRLANQPYLIMPSPVQNTPQNTSQQTVSEPLQKETPSEKQPFKKSNSAPKYIVGACALAASVIAGICIYNKGKGVKESVQNASETISNSSPEIIKTKVSGFVKSLENEVPEFDIDNVIIRTYENGIKRIDRVLEDASINVSEFFDKSKKLFANLIWNDDNKIASGFHINAENKKITDLDKTAEYILKRIEEPPVSS